MQLWGRALVHTSPLRVPGSGTPDFDDHMVPLWCTMCPPSSAICGVLRSRIFKLAMFDARPPVPHRGDTAYKRTSWMGTGVVVEEFGVENSPPTMGQSRGQRILGTKVS